MTKTAQLLLSAAIVLLATASVLNAHCGACGTGDPETKQERHLQPNAEEQSTLTPASVLSDLMEGNKRYISGTPNEKHVAERIKAAQDGQFPKAYVLSR